MTRSASTLTRRPSSARGRRSAPTGSDAAVIERALNAYLLGRLLDAAQTRCGLSESEADRIAYEEIHAARRERGAA
jgi:hypothetical protein